jgi:hypothetical protein
MGLGTENEDVIASVSDVRVETRALGGEGEHPLRTQ